MCPSKLAADSTAGFLGHHWMSKHHWLLVGNSYSTCWGGGVTFSYIHGPHQEENDDGGTLVSFHSGLVPRPCLGSSTESCCPSRSSAAARDPPSSSRWRGRLCLWTTGRLRLRKATGRLQESRRAGAELMGRVYRVWFSKILKGEVAKRRSHIWMTGIRSSSDDKTS